MTKLSEAWYLGEPEVGGVMDALRIATMGHIPRKTVGVHSEFPFEGFGLVLRGHGFYRVNRRRARPLKAPAVFYIWPGAVFDYAPAPGTSWDERYLCFTGARVQDWARWRWLPRLEEPVPLKEALELAQRHQRISRLLASPSSCDQAKLEVERLVYDLYRQTLPKPLREDRFAVLIRKWTAAPEAAVDLQAAAREMKMSYSGFRQHFEQRAGLAPYQLLLRLRIDRACSRLIQTDDAVKTVAYDCGFQFVESFNRAFRQLKGMTPGEYRRQMLLFGSFPRT